jgi:monofunctional glycosyltransferase
MTIPDRPRIEPTLAPGSPLPPSSSVVVTSLPPEGPEPYEPRPRRRFRIGRALLWAFLTLVLLALVPPGLVVALRWVDPPTSSFMQRSAVQPVLYHWVPKEQIPESLRLAVVAAEDQKFWTHWGFDFIAIAEALEHNEKSKRKRGASTITQQTAKNLFLWPSRSWLRKGLEVSFTLLLELCLPKERILEIYLNIAEFGPGIYGVEAAAQKFFGKAASELNAEETARLTAVLPNPTKWRADRPGPYVQKRVDWILVQTGHAPRFSFFPREEPEVPPADGEPQQPPAGEAAPTGTPETPETAEPEAPTEGEEALPNESERLIESAPAAPAETAPATSPPAAPEPPAEAPKER